MANFRLINSVINGIWLIDEGYVNNSLLMIKAILEGKEFQFDAHYEFDKIEAKAENEDPDRESFSYWLRAVNGQTGRLEKRVGAYNDLPENSIAVIMNSGPMMREDTFCGPSGTSTKAEMIASANRSAKIKAIIIHNDSPGGKADSVEVIHDAIKNSEKKVLNFVSKVSASAAVWAMSPADHTIVDGKTSLMGGIGTMMSIMDVQPALEKIGVKFHNVRATESIDKNEDYYQLLKGNYKPIRKEMLDPLNDMFLAGMMKNRPQMEKTFEQWKTGKAFFSEKAIEVGLADEMGDFDLAVKRVHELASGLPIEIKTKTEEPIEEQTDSENNFQTQIQTKMKWKKSWAGALSFLGFGEQVAEADLPDITEAHIDTLNQGILDAQAESKGLRDQLAQAQADLQSITSDRDSWKTKAEAYGEQPGEKPSVVKAEKDNIEESAETEEMKAMNELPHNKRADELVGAPKPAK